MILSRVCKSLQGVQKSLYQFPFLRLNRLSAARMFICAHFTGLSKRIGLSSAFYLQQLSRLGV